MTHLECISIYIYIYITKGSLLAGYLEFYFAKQRGGLDPLSLNDQEKGTPPLPPLKGNSRHMPCASLHAAAPSQCLIISIIVIILILIIIIIRLEIRFFRHPFSKYPRVRWKWQVRASIGTAKRDIGVCANTDRVFFPARDACVWQRIPPNGYLNGLSDEQPWTSWGALFSDPDISALLWMSSSMPPKWTLVTCLVHLFTQQPLRSVLSSASSSSSSSSSSFDLRFGFFDIHLPRHFNFCKQTGEAKERRRFSMLRLDRNFPFVLSKRWFASAWRPYWQA